MTVLSTFCSTFPRETFARVTRTVADRFGVRGFDLRVVRVAPTEGRRAFVEGGRVVRGAREFGAGGSIASGVEGDVWAIRASDTDSAIRITFTARLTERSAGDSRRFRRGLAADCPGP